MASTKIKIPDIFPKGTYTYFGVLGQAANGSDFYTLVVYLPVLPEKFNITAAGFRPTHQTAIKDDNPTIDKYGSSVMISTTDSRFRDYVGKNATVTITFS